MGGAASRGVQNWIWGPQAGRVDPRSRDGMGCEYAQRMPGIPGWPSSNCICVIVGGDLIEFCLWLTICTIFTASQWCQGHASTCFGCPENCRFQFQTQCHEAEDEGFAC